MDTPIRPGVGEGGASSSEELLEREISRLSHPIKQQSKPVQPVHETWMTSSVDDDDIEDPELAEFRQVFCLLMFHFLIFV